MIDLESYIKLDNDIRQRPIVFQGTHAEWETLTSTQKAHYQYIAFTDDTGSPEVVDQVPTQNSTHLVQSGGVWTKANRIDQNFGSVELSSTAAYPHSVGETFINSAGQMVKCTAAIAVNDTIIINSNVAVTNVASVLSELNSKSTYKVGDVATISQILATGYYNTSTRAAAFVLPLSKVIDNSCAQISVHIGSINVIYNTTNIPVTTSLNSRDIEGIKQPYGLYCECGFTDGISSILNPTFLVSCTISFM